MRRNAHPPRTDHDTRHPRDDGARGLAGVSCKASRRRGPDHDHHDGRARPRAPASTPTSTASTSTTRPTARRPLVLLHGGLGSGEMFGPVLPALAAGHQVILPDLQGHGRTADIDRPHRRPADGRRHRRPDRPPRAGEAGRVRLLARWRRRLLTAVRHPEMVGRIVILGEHPARRDLPGDARPAGAGGARRRPSS